MSDEHILVVDDDPRLLRLLQRYLSENGYRVSTALDALAARQVLERIQPDALVLDVTMPGEDGLSLTNSLRKDGLSLPILLLTARGEPADRIGGLEAGADDYLGKPFEPRELLLRLRAHLRRVVPALPVVDEVPDMLRLGELEFDVKRGLLSGPHGPVHLTGGEAALLGVLTAQPGTVLSREAIARALEMDEIGERAVDVQVTRLRRRIEPDPKEPRFLHTVRGKGYVLKPGR
ncbi:MULTISPECIES: response regulator [Gluconobacter]|uniref:DNA-binding response regulator n=2 Tax=Gluconobacter TaxID=441 RepID=A0A4Y3M5C4_9PROT|nr:MULTISPECIES: response regulator transcription factor [Gluconobacter]KXV43169.1 chemotaxis protein CheY [Gluconobacter roseus]MBF0858059.1 response regulator transcription factor [Gluconobacter vitians]GBR43023.1 two component response regulator OmpR [Gluconobacter roseus NBRC 3990]GEB03815.1 DNA-binding response regulator [Gluconobacter roseus NBRC 3990]GLP94269.1 DNA-binding response regulator [Gluconobacter roseus NBRC 3990]